MQSKRSLSGKVFYEEKSWNDDDQRKKEVNTHISMFSISFPFSSILLDVSRFLSSLISGQKVYKRKGQEKSGDLTFKLTARSLDIFFSKENLIFVSTEPLSIQNKKEVKYKA